MMPLNQSIPTNITAEKLNAEWDNLVANLDAYYNSMPANVSATLNKAVSDWQNFYYGFTDAWPEAELENWREIYRKSAATLQASVKQGAQAEATPVANKPAPKTDSDAVFYVRGQVEPIKIPDVVIPKFAEKLNLTSPKWLLPTLIAIPASAFLYKLLRKHRRKSA
jgi:hypothetical protein